MKGERTMKNRLEEGIKAAMIDTGRAAENWRIKVTGHDKVGKNSDYVRVYVSVYKPRSRKPDVLWDLCVNVVKNLIYWDYSTFAYPKKTA
jgi:hypothetical protein